MEEEKGRGGEYENKNVRNGYFLGRKKKGSQWKIGEEVVQRSTQLLQAEKGGDRLQLGLVGDLGKGQMRQ